MKVYVFPGQGSQVQGMGMELFQEFPELIKKADEILGFSIEELCRDNPEEKLNLTQYTQPALFIVNALTYLKKIKETGEKPDFVAGHSLGEYNALFAAGAFDFETGVKLVKKRGELMGQAKGGAMAAVVGLSETQVREILQNYQLDKIDIANLNAPKQIVIASTEEEIVKAKDIFTKEGASYVKLKVSAAFHSRYMKDAQKQFGEYLKEISFTECSIPVISNYTARPYEENNIIQNLTNQLGSAVRWTETITYLMEQGEIELEEVGPGHVLMNLYKKIIREWSPSIQQESDKVERNPKTAEEQVKEWNVRYPIGTTVSCNGYSGIFKTRTKAKLLFGHRAAIYLEDYNGYFSLEDVKPIR